MCSWVSCPGRHLEISETDLRWLQGELDKLRWDAKQRMLSNTGAAFSIPVVVATIFWVVNGPTTTPKNPERIGNSERVKKLVISALLVSVNWKVLSISPIHQWSSLQFETTSHHEALKFQLSTGILGEHPGIPKFFRVKNGQASIWWYPCRDCTSQGGERCSEWIATRGAVPRSF